MQRGLAGFAVCLITRGSASEMAALERALPVAAAREVAVLLRNKQAPRHALGLAARKLAELARAHGAPLYIHTHTRLAVDVGADGVHLASDPAPGIRAQIPSALRMGVSCHDAEQLRAASREAADYAFLSPFAPVPGKAPALGAEGFAALARDATLPVVALGGIGPANAAAAIAAGACGVACIRSVLDAEDPAAALRALLAT